MKWFTVMLLAASLMLVGCEKKGTMEKAADDLGGAMKKVGKKMDKAVDETNEAIDNIEQ